MATTSAAAGVVDDLEQQEVREQEREQARVAVQEADEVGACQLACALPAGSQHPR